MLLVERLSRIEVDVLTWDDHLAAVAPGRVAELPVLVAVEGFPEQIELSGGLPDLHAGALRHHSALSRSRASVNGHPDGRYPDRVLGPAWGPEDLWRASGPGSTTN